jgi:hypothetical protein
MSREVEAAVLLFTDAVGLQTKKARPLTAWRRQVRAVVSQSEKPTGVSADNTRAGLTSTRRGERTTSKLAKSLSLRSPVKSRHGAGDERPTIRQASSNY